MWKQVAPLFVIAVLVGWFMPAPDPVAAPVEPAAKQAKTATAPASISSEESSAPENENSGETVLYREGNGHFYASGNVDGADLRFLVDTGASVVALTEADAETLGHYLHPGEMTLVGQGVSGPVKGKPITIARMAVGGISAENVKAVIIPDGLPVSLLGQSFLSQVAHVSISGNRMVLKN